MLSKRHLYERVGKVRLAGLVLPEPDLMEALPADASAKMGMKLVGSDPLVHRLLSTPFYRKSYLNLRQCLEVQTLRRDCHDVHGSWSRTLFCRL